VHGGLDNSPAVNGRDVYRLVIFALSVVHRDDIVVQIISAAVGAQKYAAVIDPHDLARH